MPVTYLFLADRNLIFVRMTGHIVQRDIFKYFAAYEKDTAITHGCAEIVDLSPLENLDISFNEMRTVRLRERDYYLGSPQKVTCMIYAPNDTGFGMARMYQQLVATTDDHDVTVVKSEVEALAGAGQPETSFAALLAGTDLA